MDWLQSQGFNPQKEQMIGKGQKVIRADIVFKDGKRLVAVEVKTSKSSVYDGIGKAMTYLSYGSCDVWLAVPHGLSSLLVQINEKVGFPFYIFDIANKQLYEPKTNTPLRLQKYYVCAVCGEVIGQSKWINKHMRLSHRYCIEDVRDALKLYRSLKHNQAYVDWVKSHSEELESAENEVFKTEFKDEIE